MGKLGPGESFGVLGPSSHAEPTPHATYDPPTAREQPEPSAQSRAEQSVRGSAKMLNAEEAVSRLNADEAVSNVSGGDVVSGRDGSLREVAKEQNVRLHIVAEPMSCSVVTESAVLLGVIEPEHLACILFLFALITFVNNSSTKFSAIIIFSSLF